MIICWVIFHRSLFMYGYWSCFKYFIHFSTTIRIGQNCPGDWKVGSYVYNSCINVMFILFTVQLYVCMCWNTVDCLTDVLLTSCMYVSQIVYNIYIHNICDRACENQPCERKLHRVILLLISFVLNALSYFR